MSIPPRRDAPSTTVVQAAPPQPVAVANRCVRRSMERWGIGVDGPLLSFDDVFDGTAIGEVVLDIGFGGGDALIEARRDPRPTNTSSASMCTRRESPRFSKQSRSRAAQRPRRRGRCHRFHRPHPAGSLAGDPCLLSRSLAEAPASAAAIDPRRDHGPLIPLLRRRRKLHVATDVDDYATQIRQVCEAMPDLSAEWSSGRRGGPSHDTSDGRSTKAVDRSICFYTSSSSSPSDSSSASR